ncbi:MAG: putative Kinesin-II 95 kDa subunit [Streblomastix strix]|uniref:Putative Kinesin-II 95 kDa subunit n=1 Tax=Streblomastix strix TaxID=222440 RepID=A0A5J4VXB5_9EUKA|nr:MAG: putative Kinesin-II 95 kDa subunit [Streblomastix strix]
MTESVTVAVRVRPLNSKEKTAKDTEIQQNTKTSITITNPTKKESKGFTFDYVYGTSSTQNEVYNDLGKLYLENAWAGFNCTLFAYGQTGSGKSYSMTGNLTPEDQNGIIPRGCQEMFSRITSTGNSNVSYEVRVSFLEMYNEKLQDLLDPKTKKTINIRESPTKGIYVENVIEEPVTSYSEIDKLLADGNKVRTVAATAMNATSSRSHSVLTIFFTRSEIISGKKTQKDSRINLVDLAGSERQSQTESTGDRLAEACAINKSLSALGNVISALADQSKGKSTFVPYRDSLLTRMLQDSLGGNSKTIMIAAVSPASSNYDETLSTLQYADRAKQIKNKPVVNESETDKLIKQLRAEIEALKSELENRGSIDDVLNSSIIGDLVNDSNLNDSKKQELDQEEARVNQLLQDQQKAEIDFQQKKQQALEEVDRRRAELFAQQEETAQLEAQLAAERVKLGQDLAQIQSNMDQTDDEKQAAMEFLRVRGEELEQERLEILKKLREESRIEEELTKVQAQIDDMTNARDNLLSELTIAQQKLDSLTLTIQEKKQKNQEANLKRKKFLEDSGLSLKGFGDAIGIPDDVSSGPQLRNISTDWDLNGLLVYYLPGKCVTLGSEQINRPIRLESQLYSGAEADDQHIILQGLGIQPIHCAFMINKSKKQVTLKPMGVSRVMVNGEWVGFGAVDEIKSALNDANKDPDAPKSVSERVLKTGDRLIIGRTSIFRFVYPSAGTNNQDQRQQQQQNTISGMEGLNEDEIETIQAELAVISGKVTSVAEYKRKKDNDLAWIVQADQLVDEANEISKLLGRQIAYSIDILEDHRSINVKVNSFEKGGGLQEWDLSVLADKRLPQMRMMLADQLDDGIINGSVTRRQQQQKKGEQVEKVEKEDQVQKLVSDVEYDYKDDPFFNPPQDELIGLARFPLCNAVLAGAIRITLPIRLSDEGAVKSRGEKNLNEDEQQIEDEQNLKEKEKQQEIEYDEDGEIIKKKTQTLEVDRSGLRKGEVKIWVTLKQRGDSNSTSQLFPIEQNQQTDRTEENPATASIYERPLPMKEAPPDTFLELEPRDARDPIMQQDPLPLIPIQLKKVVDYDQVIGKEVILRIDFKQISFHPQVQAHQGVFIRFDIPPFLKEEITKRIQDHNIEFEEEYEDEDEILDTEQQQEQLNESKLKIENLVSITETQLRKKRKTKRTPETSEQTAQQTAELPRKSTKPINFDTKRYKLLHDMSYKITFHSFQASDLDLLMKGVLGVEVWGHRETSDESYVMGISDEELDREDERTRQKKLLQIEIGQSKLNIEQTRIAFQQRDDEIAMLQKQIEDLLKRQEELKKVKKGGCVIL